MSTERKMTEQISTYVSEKVKVAGKDYECYGCDGEQKIFKGEKYLEIAIRTNGRLEHKKLCIRCWIAFWNKNLFSNGNKEFDGKGCLKFSRLSSNFRKNWNAMAKELKALPEDEAVGQSGIDIQKKYMDLLCPPEKIAELDEARKAREAMAEEERNRKAQERKERQARANARKGKKTAQKAFRQLVMDLIELKTETYRLGVNDKVSDLLERLGRDREAIGSGLDMIS